MSGFRMIPAGMDFPPFCKRFFARFHHDNRHQINSVY
jgi:hypothetical protein